MKTIKPEQAGCSSARLERIDRVMQRYVDEKKIAGILATVARRGQVVYSRCFGMMDIEAGKPMAFDTLFRIYSMTKPITSVAVMMLYEEGYFQLSDPISRFIPEFGDVQVLVNATESGMELANLEREITIRHLLISVFDLVLTRQSVVSEVLEHRSQSLTAFRVNHLEKSFTDARHLDVQRIS